MVRVKLFGKIFLVNKKIVKVADVLSTILFGVIIVAFMFQVLFGAVLQTSIKYFPLTDAEMAEIYDGQ